MDRSEWMTFRTLLATWRRAAALAAIVVAGAAATASAQQPACIAYEHAGFRGDRLMLTEGQTYNRLDSWNDRISSIAVANGCSLRVGYRKSFGGRQSVFDKDAGYVGDNWNDVISSVSCTCEGAQWRRARRGDSEPLEHGGGAACVVYDRRDFGGASLDMDPDQVYARLRNWNDRVSSARVAPGCNLRMGEHWNFGGDDIDVIQDVRYLGSKWNNRASALACECGAGWRESRSARREQRRGAPPKPSRDGAACVVFADDDFRGAWRAFERGDQERTLGRRLDQKVTSVQVAPGCVALLDVNRSYKLWIEQNVRRLGRAQNDRADTVSCFCPRGWRK